MRKLQNDLENFGIKSNKGAVMKISIIMPTRNRPDNLQRLFDSLIATVADPLNVEVSSRIDEDDILSKQVFDNYIGRGFNCRYIIGPRSAERLNPLWNDAWKNATGEIYMMSGDDFVFRTPGWDTVIRNEFEKSSDKIRFIFGEDGIQHAALGTHGFIHKNWTDALGYFVQPYCMIYYFDTWNDEIAKMIGRKTYLPNLFFEHMHHSVQKSPTDALYNEMQRKGERDDQIWQETAQVRIAEANKLKSFIERVRNESANHSANT